MDFEIEKKISYFVENQFPQFYRDEGSNFVQFVKAYYEWMEEEGNAVYESRSLLDYRDIDNTLEEFLEHFQRKYLYGIPFNVIINKRYLLKHILDVYRSKGSIQCIKLLFRLIYNQDADVYLPSTDMLRLSDGTWVEPLYLEVSAGAYDRNVTSLIGKTIVGLSSGTTAVVEKYSQESFNSNKINIIYITGVMPRGGNFTVGEKIIPYGESVDVEEYPTVSGSLKGLNVINGGQGFDIGDIVKIAGRDVNTGKLITTGIDGLFRVAETASSPPGALGLNIIQNGFGFNQNSKIFLYRSEGDTTGVGAGFNLGDLGYNQSLTYNSDIICDYLNVNLDSLAFGFGYNPSANAGSTISGTLKYVTEIFGSPVNLTNIETGQNYSNTPYIFTRSTQNTVTHFANVSFNTTSNSVTGTGTQFTNYFTNNSVIYLQANSTSSTGQYHMIRTVNSDTSITLYAPPSYTGNIASGAFFKVSPTTLTSNFALYEDIMNSPDESINGENCIIEGSPSQSSQVVSKLEALDSGKGYIEGSIVKAYRFQSLATPIIINGGLNYKNGDLLSFIGGETSNQGEGYVTVDGNGTITGVIMIRRGSNYLQAPRVVVQSRTGSGAQLIVTLNEYDTSSSISGKVEKIGIGKKQGYWTSTRGFLNSDKYIQDSYFYQDFSYQIKAALTLEEYKNVLYDTFHVAGMALFGTFNSVQKQANPFKILFEVVKPNTSLFVTSDQSIYTADSGAISVDQS